MTAFKQYAPWYDLLYRDKDYASEAVFVADHLRGHGAHKGALLDLGCGTGAHALEFVRRGWHVTGVDLSADMISLATERTAGDPRVRFRQGDICKPGEERDFDAAISLFHVASYQTSPIRLQNMLMTASAALKPGGILLFDYWYGGAVLAQGLETRVKVVEDGQLRVTRIAQADHDESRARVQVNYTLFCEDTRTSAIRRIEEAHQLRYWFPFEIEPLLRNAGFEVLGNYGWLTNEPPTSSVWAAYCVAKKVGLP